MGFAACVQRMQASHRSLDNLGPYRCVHCQAEKTRALDDARDVEDVVRVEDHLTVREVFR
ncbi:MAG: hypothetical protein DMF84_13235 [Acidobacteria bacterium]|nr:MAG: hypothetical protein DMF84_13235 [Acidobacteriota bacterium]